MEAKVNLDDGIKELTIYKLISKKDLKKLLK